MEKINIIVNNKTYSVDKNITLLKFIETNMPNAKYNIARCYLEMMNYDLAIKNFQFIFENYKNHSLAPNSLLQIGQIYQSKMENKKAIDYYRKVVDNYPSQDISAEALFYIGKIYLNNKDTLNAEKSFIHSSSFVNNVFADRSKIELAAIYLNKKEKYKAIEIIESVASSRTDNIGAEAQFRLGEIYFNEGDYKQAITEFMRIKYIFPKESDLVAHSLLKVGQCYEATNDIASAKKIYKEIIKLGGSSDYTKEAQNRLNQISK